MAKAGAARKQKTETAETPARAVIRARTPMDWGNLLKESQAQHWRKLRVTIQVRDRLMAGKPALLDAAQAMLKARGLDDHIEAVADIEDPELRAQAAERIKSDEGLCEFTRRPGHPGIWIPSNNVKAGLKENWSVLGYRVELRGSRGALAEGTFACGVAPDDRPEERDWIRVGDSPAGVHTAVSHSVGPKGPVSSIKRHEFVERVQLQFELWFAEAIVGKLDDKALADTLIHFGEHGLGACRSQGFGKFDIIEVAEIAQGEG